MRAFQILSAILHFILGSCFETYVVHTSDNKLHFINKTTQTHQLHLNPVVKADGEDSEHHSAETGIMEQYRTQIGLPTINKNELVELSGRVDRIYISSDGVINFLGRKIFIDELLAHPLIEDGMYISVTQEHHPNIINKTFVVTATTKVSILDVVTFESRILTFSQVLYLHEIFKDIPKRESEIYLNRKWWVFDSPIVAIYMLKESNGLNFMLRVFDKSSVGIYRHRRERSASKKLLVILPFIFILTVAMFLNRNLTLMSVIIKHKLYTGRFLRKDCLVYEVSNSFLRDCRRSFELLKSNSTVSIMSDSEGWMRPLIVTEPTSQFTPARVDPIPFDYEKMDSLKIISVLCNREYLEKVSQFKAGILRVIQCVEEIHSRGVAYGRLCPENVRVSANGHIKLQCLLEERGWCSSRQLKNNKSKCSKASEFDDIFSLGCLIHYYLTGYHPYDLRNSRKNERKSSYRKPNGNATGMHSTDRSEDTISTDIPIVDNGGDDSEAWSRKDQKNILKNLILSCKGLVASALHAVRSCLHSFFILNFLGVVRYICSIFVKIWPINILLRPFSYIAKGVSKVLNSVFSRLFGKEIGLEIDGIYRKVLPDDVSKYIEYNVLYNTYRLRIDDQIEHDLIYHCLKSGANGLMPRLTSHPYFWDNHKYLEFICDVSDFVETNSGIKIRLERNKRVIFTGSWMDYLDQSIIKSASTKRAYDGQCLCDLIRLIRNCHRHYQELKGGILEQLEGSMFFYIGGVFPELLMFLYRNPLFKDHHEGLFKKYY